jgi:anthranilate synthase/aminodeoxychorismate synthase-like glutamine amidotransferase
MIALIDNYDSFTYNLYQMIEGMGLQCEVIRNDATTVNELLKMNPTHLVISPGPGRPEDAGITLKAIKLFSEKKIPILGICLGHQAIAQAFGIPVVLAPRAFHGKCSRINHDSRGIFENVPQNLNVTRYHSLMVGNLEQPLHQELEFTCFTDDGIPMGIRHKTLPIEGLQFHPESYATQSGALLLENFFKLTTSL